MKAINILLTILNIIVIIFICILVLVSMGIIMLLAISYILMAFNIKIEWFSINDGVVAVLGSVSAILVLLIGMASINELFNDNSNEEDVPKVNLKKEKLKK